MPDLLTASPALPNLMAAPAAKAAVASAPAAERANPGNPPSSAAKAAGEGRPTAPGEPGQEAGAGNGQPPSFAAVLRKQMAPAQGEAAAATTVDPALLIEQQQGATSAGELQTLLPFIEQMMPLLMAKGQKDEGAASAESPLAGITPGSDGALITASVPVVAVAMTPQAMAAGAAEDSPAPDRLLDASAGPETTLEAAISAETAMVSATTSGSEETDFSALVQRAGEQLASTQHQAGTGQRSGGADAAVRIDTPVGHRDWSTELGNKLTWMATAQRQQADLVLNPPQLGRVEVSLTVSGDQASAVFASPNAAVRELIEDSLPRLKEILSGAGINLGEAQVGSESPSRFGNPAGEGGRGRGLTEDHLPPGLAAPNPVASEHRNTRVGLGMVDIFA